MNLSMSNVYSAYMCVLGRLKAGRLLRADFSFACAVGVECGIVVSGRENIRKGVLIQTKEKVKLKLKFQSRKIK